MNSIAVIALAALLFLILALLVVLAIKALYVMGEEDDPSELDNGTPPGKTLR